jgi:DNA-directed RNA polymerase specialized sigma24 family protein
MQLIRFHLVVLEFILELALIERCKEGEEKAYAELYGLYKGYIFTTCVRYGIGDFEIKDMMQTIFIEAFRCIAEI